MRMCRPFEAGPTEIVAQFPAFAVLYPEFSRALIVREVALCATGPGVPEGPYRDHGATSASHEPDTTSGLGTDDVGKAWQITEGLQYLMTLHLEHKSFVSSQRPSRELWWKISLDLQYLPTGPACMEAYHVFEDPLFEFRDVCRNLTSVDWTVHELRHRRYGRLESEKTLRLVSD